MRPPAGLGPAQFEVLKYIQEHHPISVREAADYFADRKGYARTTVLTMMERLREKRYLTRRKVGGLYRYSPRVTRMEMLNALVRDFIGRALEQSVDPLTAYFTNPKITQQELDELRRLVRELEAGFTERKLRFLPEDKGN